MSGLGILLMYQLTNVNKFMERSFDQKWGGKILLLTITLIAMYFLAPVSLADDEAAGSEDAGFWSDYYETMVTEVYTESGLEGSIDWNSTSWDSRQNIYLLAYQQTKSGPANAAIQKTAQYFGYTEENMKKILDGDIAAITTYDEKASEYIWTPDIDLANIEVMFDYYALIVGYYEEYFAEESIRSELNSTAIVQEMFVNGDNADSGFDLLYDLYVIETILFNGYNETGYGGSVGGLGSPDFGGGDGGVGSDIRIGDGGDADVDGGDAETETSESAMTGEETEEETTEEEQEEELDKSECFEDTELEIALNGFLSGEEEGDAEADGDGDGGDGDGDGDDGDGGDGDGDGDDDDGSGEGDAEDAEIDNVWAKPDLCNDFFCLEIKFITEGDEDEAPITFDETSNCIYCHFSYIGEKMNEVATHDLAGGKVTGNLMEDATCKEDSTRIIPNMNVFAISNPIITPTFDDIVVEIGDIAGNFMEAIYPEQTVKTAEDVAEGDPEADVSAGDLKARYITSVKGEVLSLTEITDEVITQLETEYENRIVEAEQSMLFSQMNDMTTMFQAPSYEMDQMKSYFQSIEDMLKSLYESEGSNTSILDEIYQKEYKDA